MTQKCSEDYTSNKNTAPIVLPCITVPSHTNYQMGEVFLCFDVQEAIFTRKTITCVSFRYPDWVSQSQIYFRESINILYNVASCF